MNLISFELSTLGAFGQLSLLLALAFTLLGLGLAVLGGLRRDERLTEGARRGAWVVFGFSTLALFTLEVALLRDDFSVRYVAQHSMTVSPLWVKVVTLWAALEGSILLWAWLLALYTFLLSLTVRRDALRPWVLASMFVSLVFFVGVNATIASPFTPVASPPAEGGGPNPLLQNHWMMAVHPVLLYFGFVGLAVPFAYAVAALVTGRSGSAWITQTRRWTVVAWSFLSAAIVAGGWWSYEVLGWGGYWAWDAVENASLVPWLLATAFLHSIQIQERRRMLAAWNVWLIVAAYGATILGTFINRSGVVESVHAFGSGPVGPVFLGFFAVLMLGGAALAAWRTPLLRDEHAIDTPVSREGAYLAGNVLFLVFAVMVVIGTLFPALVEAVRGVRVSVGPPFFNTFAVPMGLGLLFLMGVGPLLPWRRAPGEKLLAALRLPAAAALMAATLAVVFGVHSVAVVLTVALCAYNVAGLALLSVRAARQRGSFVAVVREQPRRHGAHLAHLGLVIVALGLAFSGGYKREANVTLNLGQERQALNERLQFLGVAQQEFPERRSVYARVLVDGVEYRPRLNIYPTSRDSLPTPAVRYRLLSDTYLVMTSFDAQGGQWVALRLIESPLVSWIWAGTVVIVLGAALTLVSPAPARAARRATRSLSATD
ncbi:heme lyase CcmF/NrfE family subunit [Deinococcus peraridilitoris]|uniref:Cytochrome c biogenesis factor n=1 Tax=Deinococcus peraridilitoris (strain DSM 19664 / LMG 22246 / CIP 109416 / KR-200) TaxID=937777 RepID=L0A030_DEIPD|nr:heme lyase CcmF/NrfE family subunit [Deinococcus peraridilitoris]AFZ66375.1 cytochrome c biogenesis factor [Deinococcus peraridilitoris DSM 19664]